MALPGLAWWGHDRLVLSDGEHWQVRSWPAGSMVGAGTGMPVPSPDGRRWATVTSELVEVDGVVHHLPVRVHARAGCWWRNGVCVVGTDFQATGTLSELWWVTAKDGPVRLAAGIRGRSFHSVTNINGCLVAEEYTSGDAQSVHQVRLLIIQEPDSAVKAVPRLSGSIHQLVITSTGSRVVLWSENPNFTQHLLVESDDRWAPVTPELRIAGHCEPLTSGKLLISAYDGIRAGVAVVEPQKRLWRWSLTDTDASFLPLAVHADGQVAAVRRPADGEPCLVSITGETTREVLPLPALRVPAASVYSWVGPASRLEGLFVSPPGTGPWPLVVDVHGGPDHSLVAGFEHELDRWRQEGFAALAPEYAAAGIAGSQRRAAAWTYSGPPEQDPSVQDVASGIATVESTGTASSVLLFGWSWGGALVNKLVATGAQYQAAVSWEGVADLRLLDERMGGDSFRRSHWGSPAANPGPWKRASPISRAAVVRTPMLLIYGEAGCPEQGQAWRWALERAGVPVDMWIYPGGHLPDREVVQEIYRRAAAWFRRWS